MNEQNAERLGTEHFEVSYHGGARPTHQVWQGRVNTKKQLETVCDLGTVQGLCGANCYHDYSPFIPGISERTYTDEQLDKMNAEENKKTEYADGKEYTKYEALQRQRKLETTMRAQRQQIKLLEEGGADEDDIINARCRYRGTSQEYTAFSKAMGLPQQRERVTVDGLGSIGVGKIKKGLTNEDKQDILKEKVKNGEITLILNPEKQKPHVFGTTSYDVAKHKSYFVVSENELQDIINSNYATGTVLISKSGQIKEILNTVDSIGVCVSVNGDVIGKTNCITIHYSKDRTHMVPKKRS